MDEYIVVIIPLAEEDGGGYIGLAPDLQGCMSDGETREEALANTQQAISEWIETQQQRGAHVPEPGSEAARIQKKQKSLVAALKAMTEYIDHADGRIQELERALEDVIAQLPKWDPNLPLLTAIGASAHSVRSAKH